jgi:hypothetical protein
VKRAADAGFWRAGSQPWNHFWVKLGVSPVRTLGHRFFARTRASFRMEKGNYAVWTDNIASIQMFRSSEVLMFWSSEVLKSSSSEVLTIIKMSASVTLTKFGETLKSKFKTLKIEI